MRMVAAAQAAGVVPTVVTRESLGVRNPQRAMARALAAKVAATKSPKTPAVNRPSRPNTAKHRRYPQSQLNRHHTRSPKRQRCST